MDKKSEQNQTMNWGRVFVSRFSSWRESLYRLLDAADLGAALADRKKVLIKPNLVEAIRPPVTTPVELVEALVDYLQAKAPEAEIIIGEGCGARDYDTRHSFESLGYLRLARERGVKLIDLNEAPLCRRALPGCRRWPEIHLPGILFDSYLISVPVLKAHTLAGVTLTMKNMMGTAPPAHYQQGGRWKKAAFHDRIHEAILDLNRYRRPDFSILDATVGMSVAHLWGPACNPPLNMLAASYDPVALDAFGAGLLNRDWRAVGHISQAHGELGGAEPIEVLAVGETDDG